MGRAYDAAGQPDSAIAVYGRCLTLPWLTRMYDDAWWLALTLERLGQLYDERGDRERAAEHYARFIDLWAEADPELQPRAEAARERLTLLVPLKG